MYRNNKKIKKLISFHLLALIVSSLIKLIAYIFLYQVLVLSVYMYYASPNVFSS